MARQWFVILQGPKKGDEIDLTGDEIIVGRHPDCDININDPEVSRKHFKLTKKNDDYLIEDLSSMNRTVINGRPVSGEYRLRNNSKIRIGANVTLGFKKEHPKPAEERTQPIKIETFDEKEQPPEPEPPKIKEHVVEDQTPEPKPEEKKSPQAKQQPPEFKRPMKRRPRVEQTEERKTNWFAWGCFGFLLILVLAAAGALWYIDANFLWCELFEWLPGCPI